MTTEELPDREEFDTLPVGERNAAADKAREMIAVELRRRQRRARIGYAVAIVATIALGIALWSLRSSVRDNEAADRVRGQELASQRQDLVATKAGLEKANVLLKAAGEEPVPVPSTPTRPNDDTARVDYADVDRVVTARLATYRPAVTLTSAQTAALSRTAASLIPKPVNGTSVTLAQVEPTISDAVDRAVAQLPRPPAGEKGDAGPGPTDAQVQAAARTVLAEMCGETCEGESVKGDKGDSIQPGTYTCPDGQTVAGMTVMDSGLITLRCVDVPVVPGPQPSPTTEPTPSPTALKK